MELKIHDIFVNKITEDNGITKGYVTHEDTIAADFKIAFTNQEIMALQGLANMSKDGIYTFDRFCQYVMYLYYNEYGWTIILSDYHNSVDIAIKECEKLKGDGWTEKDRDEIIEIFTQIEKHKNLQKAQMVLKEYQSHL
jgi:cell fate (sporulation/competence/biofilm development) regulator YmcA (YheA/YmcA/DUF963 family)